MFIGGPHLHGEVKGDKEHEHKIDTQGYGDPDYIERQLNDILPFQGEHDQNGEKERNQGDGTDLGDEFFFIPRSANRVKTDDAGDYPCDKRDPEIDEDAFCDLTDGDVHDRALQSQPLGNNRDEDIRINRKEDHLKD